MTQSAWTRDGRPVDTARALTRQLLCAPWDGTQLPALLHQLATVYDSPTR